MPPDINSAPLVIIGSGGQIQGTRDEQQDTWLIIPSDDNTLSSEQFLGILADGMGAHKDGAAASREVTAAFAGSYLANGGTDLLQALTESNESLGGCKQAGLIGADAGTTLIALSLKKGLCSWASVGDSLLYLFREGELRPLNNKHNMGALLQRQVQQGLICEQKAGEAPSPTALYSAVCGDDIAEVDYRPDALEYQKGDRFIIASDGLATILPELEETLRRPEVQHMPSAEVCSLLLQMVDKRCATRQDNTTIVIADVCNKEELFNTLTPAHALQEAVVSLQGGRSSQQDASGLWKGERNLLAVVADGAGGHIGGAEAAAAAVDTLGKLWHSKLSHACSVEDAAKLLQEALLEAHHNILKQGGGNPANSGKCAIVVLYVAGERYAVLHTGDCRLYQGNASGWHCRTEDDSLLHMLIKAGRITPEQADGHPDQGILTQALGASLEPQPHMQLGSLSPGDSLLLCCDGFWNQLPEKLWKPRIWHTHPHKRADRLQQLAAQAEEAAGSDSDNITAIWLHPAEAESMGNSMSIKARLLLYLLFTLLLLPLLYLSYRSLAPHFRAAMPADTPAPQTPLSPHHG